jgi:cytochrome P450
MQWLRPSEPSAYALRRVALQDVHVGGQTIKSGGSPAAAAAVVLA